MLNEFQIFGRVTAEIVLKCIIFEKKNSKKSLIAGVRPKIPMPPA